MLRFINGMMTVAVLLLGIGGAGAVWFELAVNSPGPLKEARIATIRRGDGSRAIAEKLAADGIISSHYVFTASYIAANLRARFTGSPPMQLKAGEYEIPAGASVADVLAKVSEGRAVQVSVTLPEGLTSQQIVDRLKADQNLTGDLGEVPAEGTLLPDTYKFPRGVSRSAVIAYLAGEHKEFLADAWSKRQPNLPLRTPEEAVVLASIVERETGKRDERTRVAAVFINRLRQGMRLQSDPTILYGMFGGEVSWSRPIYRADIQQKNAHNTYQIDGLPPTPICNPGREAILAVLNPADTKELYFVADGTGGHVFSTTLKDHNTAVANWRKVEKDIRARQAGDQDTRAAVRTLPAAGAAVPDQPAASRSAAVVSVQPGAVQPAGGAAAAEPAQGGEAVVTDVPPLPVRKPSRR